MRLAQRFGHACTAVVLVCLSGSGPLASTPIVEEVRAIRARILQGAYADGERAARRLLDRVEGRSGVPAIDLAHTLDVLVEALTRNGKGGQAETLALARRAVSIKESVVTVPGIDLSVALGNLAAVLVEHGNNTEALPLLERALQIVTREAGGTSEPAADSLERLASAEIRAERFTMARGHLSHALAIRKSLGQDEAVAGARAHELQALLHQQLGEYGQALALLDRVIAIRARDAPDHPDNIPAMYARGDILFLRGPIQQAQQTWLDALAFTERTVGFAHPATIQVLRRLALASDALGEREQSLAYLDRATAAARGVLARCNPESIWLLNDAALLRQRNGDFPAARGLYQREVSLIETCHGSPDALATALHNSALLAADMGDLAESERLHRRSIRIWSTGLGPQHPYVARGLDALAEVAVSQGNVSRARSLYLRALDIRRRSSGLNGPDVAWTLTNLARLVADLGEVRLAQRYLDQAETIYRTVGSYDEPDHLPRLLDLRARLALRRGDVGAARNALNEALAERERIFGPAHPLSAAARASLSLVDFAEGRMTAALDGSFAAEQSGRDHLRFSVRYLPERLALKYAAKRPGGLDLSLSIAAAHADIDAAGVLDAVVRSRGIILEELAARARASSEPSATDGALHERVVASRQRYANLVLRSLQQPVARELLDDARTQKELAEQALADRSGRAGSEPADADVGLADVRTVLPPSAALVSFVRYERTRRAPNAPTVTRPTPSYAAFVVRPGSPRVAFIPLGSAAGVDAAVGAWRAELTRGETAPGSPGDESEAAYRAAARALSRIIWDPLTPHLTDVRLLFIVPDGAVNLVSFAALPHGRRQYVLESGLRIHYLSAERDLISAARPGPAGTGILAIGDPAFSHKQSITARTEPADRSRGMPFECVSFRDAHFKPLPGSRREAQAVSNVWKRFEGDGRTTAVELLQGLDASERRFKAESRNRRILHLATHRFYIGDNCAPAVGGTRAVGRLVGRQPPPTSSNVAPGKADAIPENPLVLSGLALAGANWRLSAHGDEDDGILTAEEVASMDLGGVEWVVLSACDTGLGTVAAGEGVFGLRRAFQIAGVRTVIMSLWAVNDRATRDWMEALYEARLGQRLDTADSMRQASLRFVEARRAKKQSAHPIYWAAFVAGGDWR